MVASLQVRHVAAQAGLAGWLGTDLPRQPACAPLLLCTLPPQVSHHKLCRFRVTVTNETGSVTQLGNKVMLAAVMVTHKA